MAYGSLDGTREIVLTFDDGPDPETTPRILDTLNAYGLQGIFFVVGERLELPEGRRIMERAFREGHTIANHTYSHPMLTKCSDDTIRNEIRRTQDLIGSCASSPSLFRPPYGATNSRVNKVIQDEGYMKVMWNVDTLDWEKRSIAWMKHGMDQIREREDSLVLMHDIHPTTADHVDALIENIKDLGDNIQFVSYT